MNYNCHIIILTFDDSFLCRQFRGGGCRGRSHLYTKLYKWHYTESATYKSFWWYITQTHCTTREVLPRWRNLLILIPSSAHSRVTLNWVQSCTKTRAKLPLILNEVTPRYIFHVKFPLSFLSHVSVYMMITTM